MRSHTTHTSPTMAATGTSSGTDASVERDWGARDPAWAGTRSERVLVNGEPVHVLRRDSEGDGPPQLLLHGLGGSARNWLDVMGTLASYGEVVAVDLPGFGETPIPDGGSARIRANTHFVPALLGALGWERATLVGNSMGGLIVTLTAGWWPDRAARLVLVNPAILTSLRRQMWRIPTRIFARIVPASVPGIGRLLVEAAYRQADAEELVRTSLDAVFADAEVLRGSVHDLLIENVRRAQEEPWRRDALHEACRSLVNMHIAGGEVDRALEAIEAPTLLIWGDADRLVTGEAMTGVMSGRDDWTRHDFDSIGHAPMLECPEDFCAVITGWYDSPEAEQPTTTVP